MAHVAALLYAMVLYGNAVAQQQRFWVGGSGAWSDPAHWATTANGPGGARLPGKGDAVVIAPANGEVVVRLDGGTTIGDLLVDATRGTVVVEGTTGGLRIGGDFTLRGSVVWTSTSNVELFPGKALCQVDLRGIPMAGNVRLSGAGTWSLLSDMVLGDQAGIELEKGTLVTNGNMVRAGRLLLADRSSRLVAGTSVVVLKEPFPAPYPGSVEAGTSKLLVNGEPMNWGPGRPEQSSDRGSNVCATGVGQTPFIIDAQLLSNYNGYGVSCHGVCDGSVQVSVSGGVGPFTYSWVGGPASATWSNTCPGNQIVIVTDQGQGVSCAATVQVTDPALLSVIFTGVTAPTCADVCNGTSSVFAVGGVSGYTYSWNNGAGTGSSFNQLCASANTLHVTDANGCAFDTTFGFPVQPIQPNLTVTDAQCANICDGTAQVAPTGGTGSYTYNWAPGNPAGDGTPAVSGLCAGNYSVTIQDANGCDTTLVFQVIAPQPIIPQPSHTDASCGGSCDGTATVSPTGGSGSYSFSWSPAPGGGNGTASVTGLCEGVYSVTITDNGTGCDTVVAITIAAPPEIVPVPTTTDVSCANSCDGTASAPATGGIGALTYTWTPSVVGQGTPNATQLCPGSYSLTIADAMGCDTTVVFLIGAPPPIDPAITSTDASCAGECDGTATVAATGGTGMLAYDWQPGNPAGDGSPAVTGLCAGTWSVTITDANNCDTTLQVTIAEPLPLQLVPAQTDVTCSSNCDGTATATVTGGTGPYTYLWAPEPGSGQGTNAAGGLCAGTWMLTVTDANGCTQVHSYTILPAVPMDVVLTAGAASCPDVCDGTAQAVVTGGVPTYTYLWTPVPGSGQGTSSAGGFCAGPGTLTVTDAVGCDTTIAFFISTSPAIVVNSTVTDASCNGACDGSIALAPAGGNGTYTFVWTPASAGTGATASGLCAGNYQVVVASGGCDTTLSFTINQPPPLDAALSTTDASCADACDGTGVLTGSLAGATFDWQPPPGAGQGTASASGMCPGNYAVRVTGPAGCDTLIAFTINAPAPLVPAVVVTDASCGIACDGSASATVSGGTGGGYSYLWSPAPGTGQGTANAGQLCPGNYSLTITDGAGCDTTVQFTVSRPLPIDVSAVVVAASCATSCDGSITASATGGMGAYTWMWSPAPGSGQGTPAVAGLCPGTWMLTVGDQAGCDTTVSFTVGAPDGIDPHGTFTHETCNGPCDGTATVAPTGGAGGYTYSWSPTPPIGDGTASVGGLCAGLWCVTVTDAAGCDSTWCFTILPNTPITASVATIDGLCWDECTGAATVTAAGGAGGFTYQWSPEPGAGQGTATASGLCQGPGTVTVTDAAGCDTTLGFIIFKYPPIQPSFTVVPETCAGACTGEAGAFPVGGNGTYFYAWAPDPGAGQGTNVATGLCAGVNYTLTITDGNGCDTIIPFSVPAYVPIEPTLATTPASCADTCDGTASITGTVGGSAPYTYFWSPAPPAGQGTNAVSGLCPGNYQVAVTDQDGCDTVINFTIAAPAPIDPQATVTAIACAGQCTGVIDLQPQGGSGSFSYLWSPAPPQGQGTAQVSQLCAGTWTVVIADGNGCDTTATFTLVDPLPLSASATVTASQCGNCNGQAQLHVNGGSAPYNFTWGPPLNLSTADSLVTSLCAGLYGVTVSDAAGCSTVLAVPVADEDGETITVADGTASCPGVCDGMVSVSYTCANGPCTVVWSDLQGNTMAQNVDTLAGLCAGSYLVAITNGNGCVSMDTVSVSDPVPFTADISSTPVSCANACDGSATIGITGGIGPFNFTWSPAPGGGQGTGLATGLCPGIYDVLVDDQGGCDATFSVLITAPPPVAVDASVTPISCAGQCDGSISLNAQGGAGAYTYAWTPAPPSGQGTAVAGNLCPGVYQVIVSDANGCDTTLNFTLAEPLPLSVSTAATVSHCAVCDGSATLAITGGTGPTTVQWTLAGAPVGTGDTLLNLCAGIYSATVTDAHGCTATVGVAVPDANAEALQAINGQTLCSSSCDGEISVAYTCLDAPCAVAWFDVLGNSLAQGQDTLGGLCAGTYLVSVINASGCTSMDTAAVVPSQVIVPNLTTVPVSCNGLCDGSATVGPAGGTAPYTFLWSPEPGGGQNTAQATGLCAGPYQVTIADSTGCDTVVNMLITEPQPLAVPAQTAQVTCNGACDASIVLSPTGGNGFYSYTWSPVPPNGQGSNGAFGLCAGTWTVTVADIGGCDTTLSFIISEPDSLLATATSTLSNCNVCDGTASVVPTGGTLPYTITWELNGTVVGTDSALTNLCAGLYTVQVEDANGCTVQHAAPVSDAGAETLSTTDFLLDCPNDCDGAVDVSFNCAVPACSISWFDASGTDLNEPGNTLGNLCAGTYFVQVTNGAGCTAIDTAQVTAPDPILANLGTAPVTCAGLCDGSAAVAPTGGSGGYTYIWTSGADTISTGTQVGSLCAGNYAVEITDQGGCAVLQGVLILSPDPITATADVQAITCNSACDGSIALNVQGGTGAFTYNWSPAPPNGQGTPAVSGLCSGNWTVTIADANGCDTTLVIPLVEPPVLTVDLTHTDNVCFDDCLATAHVDVSGGTAPYTILWTGPGGAVIDQDVLDVFGLCGGAYQVVVTDTNGCSMTTSFTIGAGAPIAANLSVLGESCNGPCDGTAVAAPSGGTGTGYSYLWQPGNPVGQGTDQASGLCPGGWTLTITDDAGCDSTYAFVIDPFQPITPTATIQPIACHGDCNASITLATTGGVGALSYLWSPEPTGGQGTAAISGLCPGTWTVVITDLAGCDTTVSYSLAEPPELTLATDAVTDASCANAADGAIAITIAGGMPGYTVVWAGPAGYQSTAEDISGLAPGTYTVNVADTNSCTVTAVIEVAALVSVIADAGADQVACSGVPVSLDASNSQGNGSFLWTDGQGTPLGTDTLLNVGAMSDGVHTFILTLTDGPCSDADTVVVTVLPLPIADAGDDRTIYVQGTIVLGGSPAGPVGSTFSWQPDSLLNNGSLANPTATVGGTTWFELTVVAPDGCSSVDSVLITVVPEVKVPSGFTPNGDGHNDTWVLGFGELFPNMEVQVFSRWGEPLFHSIGYAVPWDGKFDGKGVPMGTYYYVIDLHDERFPEAFTGPLTVIH
ncbi:MAG: gliding motility-associated C-terminal domain-containing protein [Flavobacteriales bacterium]|nr:gliding motility-associated C-terminal domain-containing protein [Flavobacteriales bacterium]